MAVRSSRRASSDSRADRLDLGLRLALLALDLGLGVGDQVFGVGVGIERRLVLGELADQFLEVLLVGVGLFQLPDPDGPDLAEPLGRAVGADLGGAELLGRLLRLGAELLGPALRFGLPHQLGEPFQGWGHNDGSLPQSLA